MTNIVYKHLAASSVKKYQGEGTRPLNLLKRIFNTLWLVLGFIIVLYWITPEDSYTYAAVSKDFKLIAYLGFIAISTIVAATSVNLWFKRTIRKKNLNNSDTTNFRFLRYLLVVGIYSTGFLLMFLTFPSMRIVAQTALGGAGIVAVVVAIASQEALANIVSGIFIIAFKPFKIGDIIELDGNLVGAVVDITLRHTVIRNFENKMLVIPNSIINKEKLVNMNMRDIKCCERIEINIAYGSDVVLAKKIMEEECSKHPLLLDNRSEQDLEDGVPLVKTALSRLNDFSITIRAWAWVANYIEAYEMRWDIYESVNKRFETEGISLPFHRTVVIKQDADFNVKVADSQSSYESNS